MTANPGTSASDDGAGFATSEFREEENANGLTAREVLAVIRRRWLLVLTVFAVVTAIGAWRTLRQPRSSLSTSRVRVPQPAPAVQGIGAPSLPRNYSVDPLQSEQLLIKSQSVAERAAIGAGLRLHIARPPRSRREIFGDSTPHVDSAARNGDSSCAGKRAG